MSAPKLRKLRVGDRVRLHEGGPVWRVYRVTPGAAHLSRSLEAVTVTVPVTVTETVRDDRGRPVLDKRGRPVTRKKHTGETRTFTAEQGEMTYIAARSSVWLEEGEGA